MVPRFKSSVITSLSDAVREHARFDDESIEPDFTKLLVALDEDLFSAGYEPSTLVEEAAAALDVTLTELDADEEAEDEEEDEDSPESGGTGEPVDPKDF